MSRRAINHFTRNNRVDIVNPDLCGKFSEVVALLISDNVLRRLKPSLGEITDVLDINPGAGLFSRKIDRLLRPRTHIHVDRYGYKLGDVWDLLPRQRVNRNLLVIANLTNDSVFGPREPRSPVFRYLNGILFPEKTLHHFGLVRMLAWVPDRAKLSILPRTVCARTKLAARVESAAQVTEVASDPRLQAAYKTSKPFHLRLLEKNAVPEWFELPPGPHALTELAKLPVHTPDNRELLDLAKTNTWETGSKRFKVLYSAFQSRLRANSAALELARTGKVDKVISSARKDVAVRARNIADDITAYNERLLQWDRRPYEPLAVSPSDFSPGQPLALLDFRPRLEQPDELPTIDIRMCYAHVCSVLFQRPTQTLEEGLQGLGITVESLQGFLSRRVRTLSPAVLLEVARAYEKWPFRIDTAEMIVNKRVRWLA